MNTAEDTTGEGGANADRVDVTVVIPCLNEADTIGACVRKARQGLLAAGVRGEIIVADNGSTDGSPRIASALGAEVVTVSERGYGNALAGGIEAARGTFIIMGDADDSYDFGEIPQFVRVLWTAPTLSRVVDGLPGAGQSCPEQCPGPTA